MLLLLQLLLPPALLLPTTALAEYRPSNTTLREVIRLHVRRDGSHTETREQLVRIDTPQGIEDVGERQIGYASSLEDVEVLEAWTVRPDGSRVPVPADRIRTQDDVDGSPVFGDAKVKVIIFPALEVGSLQHHRMASRQHTPYFPGHFIWSRPFSPHHRYESVEVHLTLEPGVDLRVEARGVQGGPVDAHPDDPPGTARHLYRFSQQQVHPPERGRVDLVDFAPMLSLSTFPDYAALARAYQARARPQAEVTPAIESLARRLTAGADSPRERTRRLYEWVSRNIRYVALDAGAGGFVPHPAQSILDNRYGDCKDHVALLEALLRAVGIESGPALVNLGEAYSLPQLPISEPFNHVITHVPELDLYLDSTAQFAPMGTLSDGTAAKPVLLAATGQIARTPPSDPARDFTHDEVTLTLDPDGRIQGSSRTRMGGLLEVDSRSAHFQRADNEETTVVSQLLGRFRETGRGRISHSDPLDLGTPWALEAEFELDPVINLPGRAALALPLGLAAGNIRMIARSTALPGRRYDGLCSSARHTEQISLKLPATVRVESIPPDVSFQRGPLRYESRYHLEGQVLRARREYTATRTRPVCNASDERDFDALLVVLRRDLRGQVFLR